MSVVVPFAGDPAQAAATLDRLGRLALGAGDEVIVVDNSAHGTLRPQAGGSTVSVVGADHERSSYHARNVGAEQASNDWLLFIDADCEPSPTLLDDYLAEPIGEGWGAVAGQVQGDGRQRELVARYSRRRGLVSQLHYLRRGPAPFAVTANLLVRRAVWRELGGFCEGIRSSGDAEFCWRLLDAGWSIAYSPRAVAIHFHRVGLTSLALQIARYGAGRAWLNRRRPGTYPPPRPVRGLARCAAVFALRLASRRFDEAAYKGLDAVTILADFTGYLLDNRPAPGAGDRSWCGPSPAVVLVAGAVSGTLAEEVDALERGGASVRVEALRRSERPQPWALRGIRVNYVEDDGIGRRLLDLARLVAVNPRGCARDVLRAPRARQPRLWEIAPVVRRLARDGADDVRPVGAGSAGAEPAILCRLRALAGLHACVSSRHVAAPDARS